MYPLEGYQTRAIFSQPTWPTSSPTLRTASMLSTWATRSSALSVETVACSLWILSLLTLLHEMLARWEITVVHLFCIPVNGVDESGSQGVRESGSWESAD